jgi:hypothetical protein
VPIYFLKDIQPKMVKNICIYYTLISAGMKFRNKKTYRYGIPVYTGPFRVLRWHILPEVAIWLSTQYIETGGSL